MTSSITRPAAARHSGLLPVMVAGVVLGLVGCAAPALLNAQSVRPSRLAGTVYDSTLAAPLTGASVDVILADDPSRLWRATTDDKGTFRLDSLGAGQYVVAVTHARLDSLGVRQLSQGVTVGAGGSERLRMAVPSAATLVRRVCGDSIAREGSGYVRGLIRDVERGAVATPGVLDVRWAELIVSRGGSERSTVGLQTRADDEGRFTVCGVPVDGMLQVRAWQDRDSSGVLALQVPANGILLRDVMIGRSREVAIIVRDSVSAEPGVRDSLTEPAADSTAFATTVKRGDATLSGVVRGPLGTPVANAVVSLWGTGVEQRSAADGRFTLSNVPTGSWTVEARAVGFALARDVIEVWPGDSTHLEVALDPVTQLETVRVLATRAPVQRVLERFENNRRTRGSGRFITPAMLDARPPLRTADVFRTIPGVQVVPGPFGDRVIMRAPSLSAFCTPDLWIDGVRVSNDLPLDQLVSAQDLLAVEVYASGPRAPAELTGMSGCGAIVLYTGDRKAAKR